MKVDELPVDEKIKAVLKGRGIEELYPPQAEALRSEVLDGKNLLLAIPTASGKTLVAEIVMVERILRGAGKAVYIVPLKALAEEKYREFKVWEALGLRVAVTTGDYDRKEEWLGRYDIIVATAEKFDSLLRHGPGWLREVGLLVADEIHLIGSPDRGTTLEMILTHMLGKAQIIGLSATVGNPEELAEWLGARLVVSDWRPVRLRKGVFYDGIVRWEDGGVEKYPTGWESLTVDAVKKGKGALVFVNTRRSAERVAVELSKKMKRLLTKPELRELEKLAGELEDNPTNKRLREALRGGVAFHHAGLGREERLLVEDAFRAGRIKVVVATPTLSAGVNMPAFRVVIRDTKRYSDFGWTDIPVLEIQQMMGRAGRPKYDERGEAIIVAKDEDPEALMKRYIFGKPEKLFSMLSNESTFRGQVLALIVSFNVRSFRSLMEFLERTFYYHQRRSLEALEERAKGVVYFLLENEFIEMNLEGGFTPLPLGIRTAQLYVDPLTAKLFKDHLEDIEKGPNPLGVFHLLALTPDMPPLPVRRKEFSDWVDYAYEMEEYLYVEIPWDGYEMEKFLRALKTAKLLLDWINEVPEAKIMENYGIEPGDLHRLVELADWLVYSMAEVARVLGMENSAKYLRDLQLRVRHGVREELLPLVKLPMIGRKRARALYNAGFKTLEDIAKARPEDIKKVEGIGPKVLEALYSGLGVKVRIRKGTLDDFLK
ncbi:ATP-dependent DNA helicase [Pyrococcus yayanosii]|uniref:ATP-dependent DNA helicase Hel308 n=1 Tax=Pyrococcus yayanosii (strain CH1 / JCM 16557) TaxID=529709 RepID=F8AJ27_PYRYC|nr:ATP-dependent DNA helicase [Pyrococcus yayanosii]AEH24478.1 ski2-like helicase [Pyrococcus yayanosii CH1]